METVDVLIIGAGLSGLAAGIRLSQFGRRVLIVDSQLEAGGLNGYYRRGERCFDIGLHAMTNHVSGDDRRAPLNMLLRQLRIRREELELCPQGRSSIQFPDVSVSFDNDIETLRESIRMSFPTSLEAFDRLTAVVREADAFNPSLPFASARAVLDRLLPEPRLRDVLLYPMMFYGSSWSEDMDFHQFCILFRSIFLEGLCRPRGGMKAVIDVLRRRLSENGGRIWLGHRIQSLHVKDGLVRGALDDRGEEIMAAQVLSCAGLGETYRLMDSLPSGTEFPPVGQMTFTETMFELSCPAEAVGLDDSIRFLHDDADFHFRPPENASVDSCRQVLCVPGSFHGIRSDEGRHMIRLSSLANESVWKAFSRDGYRAEKERVLSEQRRKLDERYPGFEKHLVSCEMFTPMTIERYAHRLGGAIYGSPEKHKDGRTCADNLFVCGTDQGFLGIVGALLSGVVIANQHLMKT